MPNLLRGIRERVFAVERAGVLVPPPRPDPGFVENELAEFARQFDRSGSVTTPWSHEEFVATYVGRRKTVYEQASADLRGRPVSRDDARSDSFLKAEKIPFYAKSDPAPRLIHPRTPRYNVAVGVYLKKIEHEVYRRTDSVWGRRTVLKGYNARQVAYILRRKWESFDDPICIGLDASRFDQHVSVDALRWEHARYLGMFTSGDREELSRLLSWQLETKCHARCRDGSVKYRVRGMRFSGDMNTGMGNCLLMCAMVWSFCRKIGVRAQLGNNGDDCVLFMDRSDLKPDFQGKLRDWFLGMGFDMKMENPVDVFEQVEFCQSRPVFDGQEWLMVRKHGHAQAKDCISIKPLDSASAFDKWRLSVGLAGLSLTGGIPVQQEFYTAFMRGAKGEPLRGDPTQETGFMRFARGMDRTYREPTADARYSYWLAFGITPDEQLAIEARYRATTLEWHRPSPEGTFEVPNTDLF